MSTKPDKLPQENRTPDAAGPLFTVIMPVHNRAEFIRVAVASVLAQTCKDWQLIVIDDGSSDDSRKAVEDLVCGDARAVVLVHPEKRGAGAARNTGLAAARGRWIACLDSDDQWYPDTLEAYADYIAAHPDAQFIYGHAQRLSETGEIEERRADSPSGTTGTRELFEHIFILPSASCHRRDLLDRSGSFDESLPNAEDYDLYLRMSLYCRFEPLGKTVVLRRRHGSNLSQVTGPARLCEAEILEQFLARFGSQASLDPRLVRFRLGRVYFSAANQFACNGQLREARDALARAHRYRKTFRSILLAARLTCLRLMPQRDEKPGR
jgi:glycosyltransferase involved in cell wall biosynthesis